MSSNPIPRRHFLRQSVTACAAVASGLSAFAESGIKPEKAIRIKQVNSNFEREPLIRPFGFKGNAMTNVWQTIAYLESDSGIHKIGLGTQNPLWSDASVFLAHSENGANALMYAISEYALQQLKGQSFTNPVQWLDDTLEAVWTYGKNITGNTKLRKTFALNALVGLDNALWLLYAAENGIKTFDELVPAPYRPGLSARHDKVVSIPALGYGTPIGDIEKMARRGFFIMKIKIGAPGDQQSMLEQDKLFLKNIHAAIGHLETPHSPNGKIPYYFDANGRYEKKETLHRFLDYAEQIGALPQIAVLEVPFTEQVQEDVRDLAARGPRVAADESAHTDEDARTKIQQGYNAIAVKAIAKTLSMTMKIAQVAYE